MLITHWHQLAGQKIRKVTKDFQKRILRIDFESGDELVVASGDEHQCADLYPLDVRPWEVETLAVAEIEGKTIGKILVPYISRNYIDDMPVQINFEEGGGVLIGSECLPTPVIIFPSGE